MKQPFSPLKLGLWLSSSCFVPFHIILKYLVTRGWGLPCRADVVETLEVEVGKAPTVGELGGSWRGKFLGKDGPRLMRQQSHGTGMIAQW